LAILAPIKVDLLSPKGFNRTMELDQPLSSPKDNAKNTTATFSKKPKKKRNKIIFTSTRIFIEFQLHDQTNFCEITVYNISNT
jgi:hypothetical protein